MAEYVYNPFTNRLDAVSSSSVPIDVADGGTGSSSFNINGVVISGTTSTSPLTALTLTNGQIVIGATGAPPAAASLIAGANITITPGANSITIASTAGGDVVGPAGATDEAIARFDTGTGKLIQNSVVTISDAGVVSGITGFTNTGPSTLNGAQIVKRTAPGAYPYDVLVTDYIIEVDTSAARTIRLPDAPSTGQVFVIKDVVGSAPGNNITLQAFSGVVTIDGSATDTINVAYGSVSVFFNGTAYFTI
jgi:hypothetical protein